MAMDDHHRPQAFADVDFSYTTGSIIIKYNKREGGCPGAAHESGSEEGGKHATLILYVTVLEKEK
jgi:hypothetical protein